ncbi:ATP-dependent RecD-like DNA helicase, partial [Lactobacillus sp. XV13L]|nr:ATP-dependent RecD-like DNA helicase [Lactobacillus sp. XV13L]
AQGSEFPLVILSLTMQNYVMLKRNLLYTAVTRAEKNLVLIGDPRAYEMALSTSGNDRQTDLSAKLQKQLSMNDEEKAPSTAAAPAAVSASPTGTSAARNNAETTLDLGVNEDVAPQDYILTPELIYSGQIDPMIGMQDVRLAARS